MRSKIIALSKNEEFKSLLKKKNHVSSVRLLAAALNTSAPLYYPLPDYATIDLEHENNLAETFSLDSFSRQNDRMKITITNMSNHWCYQTMIFNMLLSPRNTLYKI